MSDFPPGYSDMPPGPGGPRDPGAPYGGAPLPPPGSDPEAVKGRLRPPAIFLLIVGVLNILAGAEMLREGLSIKSDPAAIAAAAEQQWTDQQKDQMHQLGWTTQGVLEILGNVLLYGGGSSVIVGALGCLGGARTLSLRSYGLAMTSAVLTAIPAVTPCCLVGQIAGIWALIVLLQGDVRSAFR